MEPLPLIVIVGPTASGKTGLAIELAKHYGGEIISADSRAVYRGMDIGAAKPPIKERQGVPHWGLDLVKPNQRFTAAQFKEYADSKIAEIRARGRVPMLVGGTGLYIDAVIFDYKFPTEPAIGEREKWEKLDIAALYEHCYKNNIILPENRHNKRYVINTILRNGYGFKMRAAPIDNAVIVGITTERDVLRARIVERTEQLFAQGVIEEARRLGRQYGWEGEAMSANIYPLIRQHLAGDVSLDELKQLFVTKDWRLAKRQLTWLQRNEHIKWLPLEQAHTFIAHVLENVNKL